MVVKNLLKCTLITETLLLKQIKVHFFQSGVIILKKHAYNITIDNTNILYILSSQTVGDNSRKNSVKVE